MQNLHFLCQTLILFAKAVQFCRISFLTPLRFSRAKRLNLKPPSFQLSARDAQLLSYAALCRSRLIKARLPPLYSCLCTSVAVVPLGAGFMDWGTLPQFPGTGMKFKSGARHPNVAHGVRETCNKADLRRGRRQ